MTDDIYSPTEVRDESHPPHDSDVIADVHNSGSLDLAAVGNPGKEPSMAPPIVLPPQPPPPSSVLHYHTQQYPSYWQQQQFTPSAWIGGYHNESMTSPWLSSTSPGMWPSQWNHLRPVPSYQGNHTTANTTIPTPYSPPYVQAAFPPMASPYLRTPNLGISNQVTSLHSTPYMIPTTPSVPYGTPAHWMPHAPPTTTADQMNNTAGAGRVTPHTTAKKSPVPASTTAPAAKTPVRLTHTPCEAPSPYAQSHYILTQEIVVVRDATTVSSFGVKLQLDMASALVEPPPQLPQKVEEAQVLSLSVTQPPSTSPAVATSSTATPDGPKPSPQIVVKEESGDVTPLATTINNQVQSFQSPPLLAVAESVFEKEEKKVDNASGHAESAALSVATDDVTAGDTAIKVRRQRRPRRKRVFYSVMIVLDPTEQNERRMGTTKTDGAMNDSTNASPDSELTTPGETRPTTLPVVPGTESSSSSLQLSESASVGNNRLLLQKGDILLTIGGQSTGGLTFPEACMLFREKAFAHPEDNTIRCVVTIARRKETMIPMNRNNANRASTAATKVPSILLPPTRVGPYEHQEIVALSQAMLMTTTNPQRVLGEVASEQVTTTILSQQPVLASRLHHTTTNGGAEALSSSVAAADVTSAWLKFCRQVDNTARQSAIRHWKEQWALEPTAVREATTNKPYYTDAQRSALRAVQRRHLDRCLCQSRDHVYVNDIRCPLYSNLRRFVDTEKFETSSHLKKMDSSVFEATDLSTAVPAAQRTIGKRLNRDLKVVESAYKDRLVRISVENKAEAAETKFVSLMEEVQLSQGNQAICAPSLTAIVLSAVVELSSEYSSKVLSPWQVPQMTQDAATPSTPVNTTAPAVAKDCEDEDDDDDDEDDNLPLSALGRKRPREDDSLPTKTPANERVCGTSIIRLEFLATLLLHIGKKWGHVYREPSNEEYAWRWEVYHGQISESGSPWNTYTNPRTPKSLSMENIRFMITDSVVTELAVSSTNSNNKEMPAIAKLAHCLAPTRTGVWDELMAMIKTKVLIVDSCGIPSLSKNWWTKVDMLLLDDMSSTWGYDVDETGRYGIADSVRKTLHRKWIQSESGWALTADPEDVVFEYEEFDEWRRAFSDKHNARSDGVDGIGMFR